MIKKNIKLEWIRTKMNTKIIIIIRLIQSWVNVPSFSMLFNKSWIDDRKINKLNWNDETWKNKPKNEY